MKRWQVIIYAILAAAMVAALIASFFKTPDVPEFVWGMHGPF